MRSHPDIIGGFDYFPPPTSANATHRIVSHGTRSVPLSRTFRAIEEANRIRAEFAKCDEPCARPTTLPCGSEAKGDLMQERYELGLPLHHPDDSNVFATVFARDEDSDPMEEEFGDDLKE